MTALKHQPVEEGWEKDAFCKYKDPEMWDLDTEQTYPVRGAEPDPETGEIPSKPLYYLGRRHCIKDCLVRTQCLRKALRSDTYTTVGVVRGGVFFTVDQARKKKSVCLLCGWPVARLTTDAFGVKVRTICWICHRYVKCLRCPRMVRRKPGMDSYYCKYCAD